jgi:hypothetical protein
MSEKKTAKKDAKEKSVNVSWTTYKVANATYRIGTNPLAHYGKFVYKISKDGEQWLHMCVEKNGMHECEGPVTLLTKAQGEAYLELSKSISPPKPKASVKAKVKAKPKAKAKGVKNAKNS